MQKGVEFLRPSGITLSRNTKVFMYDNSKINLIVGTTLPGTGLLTGDAMNPLLRQEFIG